MSWQVIAKKELKDAVRSRTLLALSIVFVSLALLITALYASLPFLFGPEASEELTLASFINSVSTAALFIPIIAAVIGYKAVAGERKSGSLALMLSLPHTRADVVLGKFVGRAGVLAVPVVLGFAVGFVVVVALFDAFSIAPYLVFVGAVLLIGMAYLSLAICFSSITRSTTLSAVGVGTVYILFRFVWNWGMFALNALINRITQGEWIIAFSLSEGYQVLAMVSPHSAYQSILYGFVYDAPEETQPWYTGAWYLNEWTGLLVLSLWIVVPLAIGIWRFQRTDL